MTCFRPIRTAAAAVLITAACAFAQTTRPMAMTPPASAPATQSADEAAVKAALTQYNAAVMAGDVPTLQSFISVSTPGQKTALALMGKLTTAGRGVYAAVTDKFGEAGLAKDNVDRTSFPAGFPPMPVDDMAIIVTGPKATLMAKGAPDGAQPLAMTKKDGGWKIDGDALLPVMSDKQLAEQSSVLEAAIAAIDQTAADTRAGSFRGPDEAVTMLNFRVKKAVQIAQMKLAPMPDPAMAPTTAPAGPTTAPAGPQMP